MDQTKRPINIHSEYHAHIYFDEQTISHARWLCEQTKEFFGVAMGRIHERPVGPHPEWSCQLAFDSNQFDEVISWLDSNRKGLTILVHGLSGNDLADHTTHASWLGDPATLDLRQFM